MSKSEPEMKILKTSTCPTLSGKSTLTYQIGLSPDSVVYLRISKKSGGGFFSDEWLSIDSIVETLKKRQHELLDPMPFLDTVTRPMDGETKSGGTTRKTGGNAATKKAAIKKNTMSRKKTARSV